MRIDANILVETAKNKGLRFEYFSLKFDRWDDEVYPETIIQIEVKKNVWYTWVYSSDYLMFKGRYNQVNGATQKTFKVEQNAFYSMGLSEFKY
tara:strand:+ start:117 stop:395 length:279 start_codon:yes stop_codon:yes gene_type:complete